MLIICSLLTLVYLPIFGNGFAVDDHVFIAKYHPTIREAFAGVVPPGHEGVYRPVRGMLYTLYFSLFGITPFFYHLHSLIVHLAATVLMYGVIGEIGRIGKIGGKEWIGLVSGLLFGLHPIHTETITYIASSMDATGLLFFLLSWYLYLKKHYFLSFFVATISFFTTEMALTLPLFLMLQEFMLGQAVRKPFARPGLANNVNTLRNLMGKIWPYFIAAGGYLAVRFFVLGIGARGVYLGGSFYLTMLTMTKVLVQYLWLLVWPVNLMHNHIISPGIEAFVYRGYRTAAIASQTLFDIDILVSFMILLGLLVCLWKLKHTHPLVSFGIGVFFLGLVPVMEFVPQGAILNERSLYLSSIGFVLILGYTLSALLENQKAKPWAIAGLSLMLLFYAGKTATRNRDWRNNISLFTKDIEASPTENTYAYFALGNAYNEKKNYEKAVASYQKSVEINPGFAVGYASLSRTYRDMGNTELSNIHYRLANQAEQGFWTKK